MSLRALGQNLYRLRADKGWTQEQLVEAADISRRHLQLIEAGQMNPSTTILIKLKVALQCDWEDILHGTDSEEIIAAKARFLPPRPPKKR